MVNAVVPQNELALSEKPQTQIDASAFSRPLQVGIASGLEQLGAGAEDLAEPLAKKQAQDDLAKATTRDAKGNYAIATPQNSLILGRAGQDYNAAIAAGTISTLRSNVSNDVQTARAANPDDPQAFALASNGVADHYRQAYPGEVGNALANQASNEGAQYHGNMLEKAITRDVRMNEQAVTTQIDGLNDHLRVLARSGVTDSEEYREKSAQLMDAYDTLGSVKAFGYSKEKIESEKNHAIDMLNGEFVVGRIDDTFNKKGRAAAFEAVKTGIDDNPDLDVSKEQRNELHNYAMSRLSYLSGEQASNLAALEPTIKLQVKALQSGNNGPDRVPDREIDQTLSQLRSIGATKEAAELDGARIAADRTVAFRGLSPDQKSGVLFGASDAGVGGPVASAMNSESGAVQFFVSKGWTPAQASGIVGNLLRESRLNPNALNKGDGSDGSDSIGIGQWNGTRAADLKTFAAAQGKPVSDISVQLAFVQHELEGSEGNAARMLKGATDARSAATAFALGYERPQGFMTGDMSRVAGGQDRIDQALRLAGGGASSAGIATVGAPFTDAEANKNAWIRTAYRQQLQIDDATQVKFAKAQFETFDQSIKLTGNPGPDIVAPAATVLQIADRYPDQLGAQAAKLRGALAGEPAGFSAAGTPDGGENLLSAVEETVRRAPGNLLALSVAEHVKSGIEAGKKLLADDPYEYAKQNEWLQRKPAQIDMTTPEGMQGLPAAIQDKATAAAVVASRQGLRGMGMFPKAVMPQIEDVMSSGTLDQRMALLGAIGGARMTEPVRNMTLDQLTKNAETSPLAIAADVARYDQSTARQIIQGQALLKADKKWAPSSEDYPSAIASLMPFNDFPDGPMRRAYDSAAQALYAYRSASANDTAGILDRGRLAQIVTDITGGVVDTRGSKAFAPWHGATQEQFDASVRQVTDADLANSRGSDGIPLPASYLQPSISGAFSSNARFRLESVGPGKYQIYSGPDLREQRQYLVDPTGTSNGGIKGGKFVLDLGAKRQAVEAQSAGSLSMTPFSNLPFTQYLKGGAAPMGGPM